MKDDCVREEDHIHVVVPFFELTGPPNKDIDINRETANIGLVSSVGRAPARQSGGRRFKSCSGQFFFVHPKLLLSC